MGALGPQTSGHGPSPSRRLLPGGRRRPGARRLRLGLPARQPPQVPAPPDRAALRGTHASHPGHRHSGQHPPPGRSDPGGVPGPPPPPPTPREASPGASRGGRRPGDTRSSPSPPAVTRSPAGSPFAAGLADNHSSMPATVTAPTASGSGAVCPETRVKALDVLAWPRVGVRSWESPDTHSGNRRRYDGKAVGSVLARYYDPSTAQFLTVDPAVSTTLSPYGYVQGDPLNGTDPTGLDNCGLFAFFCDAVAAGAQNVGGALGTLCLTPIIHAGVQKPAGAPPSGQWRDAWSPSTVRWVAGDSVKRAGR